MTYKCLKESSFKDNEGYQIVAIRREDIENIRLWRNAQMDVLRQKTEITSQDQQAYFQKNIWPTFEKERPTQILFSFLLAGTCIGYGGLTYLDWENSRSEISFLVDPARAQDPGIYQNDFTHFLNLLFQAAFQDLHLHRLLTETFAFRHSTLYVLEKLGFKQEGILRDHVYKQGQWVNSIMHGLLANEWRCKVYAPSEHFAVLVTSISKKMPLIEAVRRAANQLGQFQEIYGCDSNPSSIGQYGVDTFWHCPPLDKMLREEIVSYCQANHITAIIPTRDADLEFYAFHRSAFHKQGIYPMVSSLGTISSCLDKKTFADLLQTHGFPVIPTFLSFGELDASTYVVKERRGSGSLQLGLNLTCEKAIKHGGKLKEPIFQPFIEGVEWSIDLYRSFEGRIKGCVARQRNIVVDGESQVTTTFRCPSLEKLCCEMAELLNIQGHAVFQVIEDKAGKFHVIECNPRFGGASTASIAVGLESFLWFFSECLGSDLQDYPFVRSEGEIRQVRYLTDRSLPWSLYLT